MKKYAIGIDLGGTSIKYALVDNEGAFLTQGMIPTYANESAQKIIEQLLKAIRLVLDYAKRENLTIEGVGIGTPGIVDESTGTILGGAENLAEWENIPLGEILNKETGYKIFVNNDANVMGFAESTFGVAKGCADVLFFTIGTGIGGSILINQKLFGGFKNRGTEFGHVPLIANGEKCACGSVGCFEHYASAAAMVRRYKERLNIKNLPVDDDIEGKDIIALYHQGDPIAVESVNENCNWVGHGIAGFINIFSPERVVIGGGLADAGEFYINKIKESIDKYAMPDCAINTRIEKAMLGNKAGCLGAASLVLSN